MNLKPNENGQKISLRKSSGSCWVKNIVSLTYGALSSRFDILRQDINKIQLDDHIKGNVPFYAWQCLTLKTKSRFIDLVVKSED